MNHLTDNYHSRGGQAVRLSYDHKGSDANEAKRIIDSGGFMLNNRVNGEYCISHVMLSAILRY
jgi:protein phosphatase PTC1